MTSVLLLVSVLGAFTPTIFQQAFGRYELGCSGCVPTDASGGGELLDCSKCHWAQASLDRYLICLFIILFIVCSNNFCFLKHIHLYVVSFIHFFLSFHFISFLLFHFFHVFSFISFHFISFHSFLSFHFSNAAIRSTPAARAR